jgi:hypothetical protein
VGGWMDVRAILRIAYSNKKYATMLAQEQLDKKVFPKKQKSSSWKKTDFI